MTVAARNTPVFEIRYHGVRGSIPVSGPTTRSFGGATMCMEMRVAGRVLIFDAGSGIVAAGKALRAEGVKRFDLFLSHWHYDHVLGLPFFAPLYDPEADVTLWSGHAAIGTGCDLLDGLMRPPYFPVKPKVFSAKLTFRDFTPPAELSPGDGIGVSTLHLDHPGGATAYRVEYAGKSVSIVTDVEHTPGSLDGSVAEFVRGTDLLLYDSTYDDADMTAHCGFGHSSWQQALRIARVASVGRVGFIHHAPMRSDAALEEVEAQAQLEWTGAFVARQGAVTEV